VTTAQQGQMAVASASQPAESVSASAVSQGQMPLASASEGQMAVPAAEAGMFATITVTMNGVTFTAWKRREEWRTRSVTSGNTATHD
jgi:hypothetical protein